MAYLIHFPGQKIAEVLRFDRMADAERAANAISSGAVFVLGTLSETSLSVLTVPLLTIIHNTARPDSPVRSLRTRDAAIGAVLSLIPELSKPGQTPQEETTMATRKKGSATKSKKAPAKKDGAKRGRKNQLAGQTLVRTGAGDSETINRRPGSRRTKSWEAIPARKSGIKYEAAIEAGAHPADLAAFFQWGHIAIK